MKNLLGLLLLIFLVTSCGKDLADNLVDTWNLKSTSYANCPDPQDNGSLTLDDNGCINFFGSNTCTQIVFAEGGTMSQVFTFSDGTTTESETDSGTYTLDGENISITSDGVTTSGSLTIDGDTMTIIGTEDGCDVTLTLLRAS